MKAVHRHLGEGWAHEEWADKNIGGGVRKALWYGLGASGRGRGAQAIVKTIEAFDEALNDFERDVDWIEPSLPNFSKWTPEMKDGSPDE